MGLMPVYGQNMEIIKNRIYIKETYKNQGKPRKIHGKSMENPWKTTENQGKSTENQRKTTENQRKSMENQRKIPGKPRKTNEHPRNIQVNSKDLQGFPKDIPRRFPGYFENFPSILQESPSASPLHFQHAFIFRWCFFSEGRTNQASTIRIRMFVKKNPILAAGDANTFLKRLKLIDNWLKMAEEEKQC